MTLTPFSDRCRHFAVFFGDSGLQIGRKKIKFKEPVFSYGNRSYNFLPEECSIFKKKGVIVTRKYYFYNINNPQPLLLDKKCMPVLSADIYKNVLDSKLIKDLNDLTDNPFWEFIKKYWWAFLIAGLIIWYFASGQDLLGGKPAGQ